VRAWKLVELDSRSSRDRLETFRERACERGVVDEHVPTASVRRNVSEPSLSIEPNYCAAQDRDRRWVTAHRETQFSRLHIGQMGNGNRAAIP
jgi:hypothetical protein